MERTVKVIRISIIQEDEQTGERRCFEIFGNAAEKIVVSAFGKGWMPDDHEDAMFKVYSNNGRNYACSYCGALIPSSFERDKCSECGELPPHIEVGVRKIAG